MQTSCQSFFCAVCVIVKWFCKLPAILGWIEIKLQSGMIHKTAKGSFFIKNVDGNVLHYMSPTLRTYLFNQLLMFSTAGALPLKENVKDAARWNLNLLIPHARMLALFGEKQIIFLLWYTKDAPLVKTIINERSFPTQSPLSLPGKLRRIPDCSCSVMLYE